MVSVIKNKATKQYLSSRFAFFHKQIKKTKLTKAVHLPISNCLFGYFYKYLPSDSF